MTGERHSEKQKARARTAPANVQKPLPHPVRRFLANDKAARPFARLCGRSDAEGVKEVREELESALDTLWAFVRFDGKSKSELEQRDVLKHAQAAIKSTSESLANLDGDSRAAVWRSYPGNQEGAPWLTVSPSEKLEKFKADLEALNRMRSAVEAALATYDKIKPGPSGSNAIDHVCMELIGLFNELSAPNAGYTYDTMKAGSGKRFDDLSAPFKTAGATFVYDAGRLLLPEALPSQFATGMRNAAKMLKHRKHLQN